MRSRLMRLMIVAPLAILGIVVFAFVGGEVVRVLWNWLTPKLFGWREITFWQGLGLLALCRILFGGRTFSRGHRSGARRRIRERMAERWERMTPEEREKWRQSFRGRWGAFEPSE